MPSLVPHPATGEPVWDYDLPAEKPKATKKAATKKAATKKAAAKKAADKGEES